MTRTTCAEYKKPRESGDSLVSYPQIFSKPFVVYNNYVCDEFFSASCLR